MYVTNISSEAAAILKYFVAINYTFYYFSFYPDINQILTIDCYLLYRKPKKGGDTLCGEVRN
jgi:hypothetical protein